MRLLDKINPLVPNPPDAIECMAGAGAVCAPVSGEVAPLSSVSDPAFSTGMLGQGVAISSSDPTVFSPVAGVVEATVSTGHAVVVRSHDGAEVMVHVGTDTVSLRGRGFACFVEKGQEVEAGSPLLHVDRALLEERGLDGTVLVTVVNSEELGGLCVLAGDSVAAGQALLGVGR